MKQRDMAPMLVDIIKYDYCCPPIRSEDAVYGFTHSMEVNAICSDRLPPYVVTPVEKEALKDALDDYLQRRMINAQDKARIRAWLKGLPNSIAIIEREP